MFLILCSRQKRCFLFYCFIYEFSLHLVLFSWNIWKYIILYIIGINIVKIFMVLFLHLCFMAMYLTLKAVHFLNFIATSISEINDMTTSPFTKLMEHSKHPNKQTKNSFDELRSQSKRRYKNYPRQVKKWSPQYQFGPNASFDGPF